MRICGESFPGGCQIVAVLLRLLTLREGRLLYLLTMLVQPGEKKGFLPKAAPGSRDNVRYDFLVRMAEMRLAVDIINGGCDVEPFAHPGLLWGKAETLES